MTRHRDTDVKPLHPDEAGYTGEDRGPYVRQMDERFSTAMRRAGYRDAPPTQPDATDARVLIRPFGGYRGC